MLRRALQSLMIFAVGAVVGVVGHKLTHPLTCSSDNECFDQVAVAGCSVTSTGRTVVKQRLVNAPPLGDVDDWVFLAYCDRHEI